MRLVKRSGVFYVHFTGTHGERRRVSTGEAQESAAKLRALELMRSELMDSIPLDERRALSADATLDYALQRTLGERWAGQRQSKPVAYRVGLLCREVGHWRLREVNYERLNGYAQERLKGGDKPATVNRKLSAIRTALTEAAKRGELGTLPHFPHLREDNVRERYLTPAEEADLLALCGTLGADVAAPERPSWGYMGLLLPVLIDTGLRLSEALGLTADNLGGQALVLRHGATKSGRGRQVPATRRAWAAVQGLLAHPLHGRVDPNWAGRRFRTMTDRLGWEDVTLHTLRHTCASRLVQGGLDLYRVKDWLGHSSVTVTERYAHLAPGKLDAGVSVLERVAASA